MISERDIWLSPKAMIARYGSNAGIEAAEHADALLEKWPSRLATFAFPRR